MIPVKSSSAPVCFGYETAVRVLTGLRLQGRKLHSTHTNCFPAVFPREAKCAILFGLSALQGGYGLGMPALGHELKCTPSARAIAGSATVRCDLYWPAARLDLEYQSHEFHEGELRRVRDSRRANALRAMGVNIVPVSDNEIESLYACDVIAATARKTLGKRKKPRVNGLHQKRLRLRRQLGLPLEPRRTFEVEPTVPPR